MARSKKIGPSNKKQIKKQSKKKMIPRKVLRKKIRNKKVRVGGTDKVKVGDEIYDMEEDEYLGKITNISRNIIKTDLGNRVKKNKQGIQWDLVYYIFHIYLNKDANDKDKPYSNWPYYSQEEDVLDSVIISAKNELEARYHILENYRESEDYDPETNDFYSDEDSIWLDNDLVYCDNLTESIKSKERVLGLDYI